MKNIVKFWLTAQGYIRHGEFQKGLLFGFQYQGKLFGAARDENNELCLFFSDMAKAKRHTACITPEHKDFAVYVLALKEACSMLLEVPQDVDAEISEMGQRWGREYQHLTEQMKEAGQWGALLAVPTHQLVKSLDHLYPF